ncbi:hypothetical protein EMMF5_000031 [Cystobasidiomycetes sp. EMM_F5]
MPPITGQHHGRNGRHEDAAGLGHQWTGDLRTGRAKRGSAVRIGSTKLTREAAMMSGIVRKGLDGLRVRHRHRKAIATAVTAQEADVKTCDGVNTGLAANADEAAVEAGVAREAVTVVIEILINTKGISGGKERKKSENTGSVKKRR